MRYFWFFVHMGFILGASSFFWCVFYGVGAELITIISDAAISYPPTWYYNWLFISALAMLTFGGFVWFRPTREDAQ